MCAFSSSTPSELTMTDKKPSLSYKDAGVDIDAGNDLVDRIKGVAKRTRRPGVMAGLEGQYILLIYGWMFSRYTFNAQTPS